MLIHRCIVGAAFLTYLLDRDDIVWWFVKHTTAPHRLERSVFVIATMLIAVGAVICTGARAHGRPNRVATGEPHAFLDRSRYFGELCYAIGLGSLAPLAGFIILVAGEALRIFRLIGRLTGRRDDHAKEHGPQPSSPVQPPPARPVEGETAPNWRKAFRQEAVKWGLLVTMIVFVITLKDRHAEILAAASFLIGMLLSAPKLSGAKSGDN